MTVGTKGHQSQGPQKAFFLCAVTSVTLAVHWSPTGPLPSALSIIPLLLSECVHFADFLYELLWGF